MSSPAPSSPSSSPEAPSSRLLLRRTVAALRLAAGAVCLVFALWMGLYGMPLSAIFGLALTAATFSPLRRRVPRRATLAGWLLVPLVIWQVALPEYAVQTRRLACTASHASGGAYAWCDGVAYRAPDLDAPGPVFTLRERLAVSGFNVVLATGGVLTGHGAAARETLLLMVAPATMPGPMARPIRERQRLCRYGAERGGATLAGSSGFFLDSRFFRRRTAELARQARRQAPGAEVGPLPAAIPMSGATNNEVYFRGDAPAATLRTALALMVPGPTLSARRLPGEAMEVTWRGPVFYPARAGFGFRLPTVHGTYDLRLDEAPFCGLLMDGWMAPYTQTWTTTVDLDDPRLTAPRVGQTEPTGLEALARAAYGLLR
jgi:hypothetical protein